MHSENDKYVAINYKDYPKTYFARVNNLELHYGDEAVISSDLGLEVVDVVSEVHALEDLKMPEGKLLNVVRKANARDLRNYEQSERDAKTTMELVKEKIAELNLNMNPLSAKYSIDLRKVLITYVAEERVDFRELLRHLSNSLKVRVELKQIGERDKAKAIGSLGPCGMETCCSRFIGEFETVSINMAKNQGLAINIPKLSGLCGKFKCCLKFENTMYNEMKAEYPPLNTKIMYKGNSYHIASMNYLAEEAKLQNKEEVLFVKFDEAFVDYQQKLANMPEKQCNCPKKNG